MAERALQQVKAMAGVEQGAGPVFERCLARANRGGPLFYNSLPPSVGSTGLGGRLNRVKSDLFRLAIRSAPL